MSKNAALPRGPHRRRFVLLCVYIGLLIPWILWGAFQALQTQANSPIDWVSSDFPARQEYDHFQDMFGAGDVVVISWDDCKLSNESIDQFVLALRNAAGFFDSNGQWYFQGVLSGREVIRQMTQSIDLDPAEARRRVSGWVLGPDNETTCVVVSFKSSGLLRRGELVPLIRAAAHRYCGAGYESLHLAGPVMDGYSVDQASRLAMERYAPLSALITLCMCIICLDSLPAAVLVFGVASLCQAISLATIHYCGDTMTALMIIMPPLIQVLAVAGGIHIVNYYFDASKRCTDAGQANEPAIAAVRIGWLPCSLSAATTAIGLGSLAVSGLVAVRAFGVYAAIGVLVTLAISLGLIAGLLRFCPISVPRSFGRFGGIRIWERLATTVSAHATLISGAAVVLMILLGIGVSRLQASVRIETLFGPKSRLMQDYAWLEQHVAPLVPIEVAVTFASDCRLNALQRIELIRTMDSRLRQIADVESVTSGLLFLPDVPANVAPALRTCFEIGEHESCEPTALAAGLLSRGLTRPGPRLAPSAHISKHVLATDAVLAESMIDRGKHVVSAFNYMRADGDRETWRLTATVSAVRRIDYSALLSQIRDQITPVLNDPTAAASQLVTQRHGTELRVSGLMPLVHEIQKQLLSDLFRSFLAAFAIIAVVMTLVQAGLLAGLLAMIPNTFPAITLFGLLGWFNHPLDIGTVMTASVAMGIAVDDTLHYLTFVRRELELGQSRFDAVLAAFQQCGRAMIQTTLICGIGLSVFVLSEFVPTARFAWMMLALLVTALMGDLIVLPALLLSPLGRAFAVDPTPASSSVSVVPPPKMIIKDRVGSRSQPIFGRSRS